MTCKEGTLDLDTGLKAFYRMWTPSDSKGLIIGVHGFVEHSGRYLELGDFLEKNGYSFAIYDLRGHGKTAGKEDFGHVDKFENFVLDTEAFSSSVMKDQGVDSAFILGHSMGGLIVLYLLSRSNIKVKGAVTSGPSLSMTSSAGQKFMLMLIHAISAKKRIKLPINAEYLSHDPSVGTRYLQDPLVCKNPSVGLIYQLYLGSKNIWDDLHEVSVPIFMLQGSQDKIVPPDTTPKAYDKISSNDKDKKIYDGFYHEILNEKGKEEVYSDILNWVSKH